MARQRDRELAWRRRRLLQRLDERGGPSRWQRWKARHPGRAVALAAVCCVAAGAGVVAVFQGGGTGAPDVRGWLLIGLLLVLPLPIASEWARERATIAEWHRAQERGEQLVPPRDRNESLSDRFSPATKQHLMWRAGLLLVLLLGVGVAALLE